MRVIAYTYEADTHCPPCAITRFGQEPERSWVREDATDAEGNPVGVIYDLDEWCQPDEPGVQTLACGTCQGVIATCDHPSADGDCRCDNCLATDTEEVPS
jgi:hypothetical protein